LGFAPFLGPAPLAVALPSLAYLLAAKSPPFHSIGYQYPAVLIPWFFLAVVEGLRRARRAVHPILTRRLRRAGLVFLVIGTLGTHVLVDPIAVYARAGVFRRDPSHDDVVEAMARIPPGAGVVAVNRLGAPLANRRVFVPLEFPPPLRLDHVQLADYVLLDLVDCRLVASPAPRVAYADLVAQVLGTGSFRVSYWSDRILLLERGVPSQEEQAAVLAYVDGLVERGRACWP
jgi:hypothetical protein